MVASPRRMAFIALAALALAGCGALFNGGPALVTFTSSPEGADVYVNGTRRGTTPLSIPLSKTEDYAITFRKDGYEEVVATISKKVGAGWVILDVLGGLVPVVIDAATGSWYTLSTSSVHGSLRSASTQAAGTLTPEQLEAVRRGVPASRFIEVPTEHALRSARP